MRIADIIGIIAFAIVLVCGVLVVANFQSVVNNMTLTGEAATAANQVFANTWTAFTFASITIIVSAAIALIVLILSSLGGLGGRAPR